MTNTQFISALKKALAGLDINSRNDIIQEITSHGVDSASPLIEQFGSAEELAKQYLEGEKIATPISSKIWGISKKVLIGIGVLTVSIIVLAAIFSYYFTKDKFNYADENADELSATNAEWQSRVWSSAINLEIDQASVVVYWHDEKTLRWSCEGDDPKKRSDSSLLIRHSQCLIYLPKVVTKIKAVQSQIVLVRPQVSLAINARQGSIKVAENDEKYNYQLNTDHSKFEDLKSYDEAIYTLQINLKEAKLSAYSY